MRARLKLHHLILGFETTAGQRWAQLLRITWIRRLTLNVYPPILTRPANHRIKCNREGISIMENGWIRCTSFPCTLSLVDTTNDGVNSGIVVNMYRHRICITSASSWLAQANYIFDRLEITRGFDDFGISPVHLLTVVFISLSFSR
jgi:hypothetical protein